tara:strand:+ start:162447 stop:162992 length:546 start_codon:yes stop_codon:yes gene_type:complete
MDPSQHCILCDHQKVTLKEGTLCGLTERKPAFHNTCLTIKLTEKFEEKLKTANIEYQYALKDKWWTYTYMVVFGFLGALAFFCLFKFQERIGEVIFNKSSGRGQGYLVVVYICIVTAGFVLFGMAIRAFNGYRNKVSKALHKKNRIDTVLNLYNIKYTIAISFGKNYHGTQEVEVDLQQKL